MQWRSDQHMDENVRSNPQQRAAEHKAHSKSSGMLEPPVARHAPCNPYQAPGSFLETDELGYPLRMRIVEDRTPHYASITRTAAAPQQSRQRPLGDSLQSGKHRRYKEHANSASSGHAQNATPAQPARRANATKPAQPAGAVQPARPAQTAHQKPFPEAPVRIGPLQASLSAMQPGMSHNSHSRAAAAAADAQSTSRGTGPSSSCSCCAS